MMRSSSTGIFVLKGYLEISYEILSDKDKPVEYHRKEEQAAETIERQITITRKYQKLGAVAP
jgi:hypothetical protein